MYQPIDCNYYDRLEAWSVTKEKVTILYEQQGTSHKLKGIIDDLYIKQNAEFLRLDNGAEIRLDQIVAVNGIEVPKSC